MNLEKLGWNSSFEKSFQAYKENYQVGRVSVIHRNICRILSPFGELEATISRKLIKNLSETTGRSNYKLSEIAKFPAVGDWVLFTYDKQDGIALLHGVLPRTTKISRNDPGKATSEQVIAANVDTVLLVMALDFDYNLRRVERYLTILWNSGVKPVIILNKADLCNDVEKQMERLKNISKGVSIMVMSAIKDGGIDELVPYLTEDKTYIFIGSSGVGKTTIINKLLGEDRLPVQEISDYRDKGKHTTSSREMIFLSNGAIVIDTPGIRRIDLWSEQNGFDDVFHDVEELASLCKFSNCTHQTEPDCAVKIAIEEGTLNSKRLMNYQKLQQELTYVERKVESRRDRRARIGYHKRMKQEDELTRRAFDN